MSMHKPAQFTPGPWTQDGLFIVAENGDVSVPICDCDVENFLDEAQANANLIAAAPAMYEALKALHSVLDQRMPDGRTLNQHLSQEVFECFYGPAIAARAAIAKAEGA